MTRGLEKPPWWAVVVFVVGLVALIVGLPFALKRGGEPLSKTDLDRLAAATSAADVSDAQAEAAIVHLTVYGDSYTGGSGMGGKGAANWVSLIAQRIPDVQPTVVTAGGAGYVQASPLTGQTFTDLVAAEPPAADTDLVIVFGSRNDGTDEKAVGQAATDMYAKIHAAAPDAKLLVIGPPWVSAQVPRDVSQNRDSISAAAGAAGATFLDPLREGWFFDQPDLIGSDGVHPTDAGHAYMADRIEPAIRQVLGVS